MVVLKQSSDGHCETQPAYLMPCLHQLLVRGSVPGRGFPQDPSQLSNVSLPDVCFS